MVSLRPLKPEDEGSFPSRATTKGIKDNIYVKLV